MNTLTPESASVETNLITISAHDDPTGSLPEFTITADTVTTPTGGWVNGSWDNAWSSSSKQVVAETPTIGPPSGAGTLDHLDEGVRGILWIRTLGAIIDQAAFIKPT